MDDELDEALDELREPARASRGCRSRVDRRRRRRARRSEQDGARARDARPRDRDEADDEADREHVRERKRRAMLQCTFSKVQQKIVARKKKLVSLPLVAGSRPCHAARQATPPTRAFEQVGELLRRACGGRASSATPRRARPRRACLRASGRAVAVSSRPSRRCRPGATTTPGAGLADQVRGGAVGRDDGKDRPLGGEVLEHLAGEHARPRPPASGIRSSSASESRWSSSERRCGA